MDLVKQYLKTYFKENRDSVRVNYNGYTGHRDGKRIYIQKGGDFEGVPENIEYILVIDKIDDKVKEFMKNAKKLTDAQVKIGNNMYYLYKDTGMPNTQTGLMYFKNDNTYITRKVVALSSIQKIANPHPTQAQLLEFEEKQNKFKKEHAQLAKLIEDEPPQQEFTDDDEESDEEFEEPTQGKILKIGKTNDPHIFRGKLINDTTIETYDFTYGKKARIAYYDPATKKREYVKGEGKTAFGVDDAIILYDVYNGVSVQDGDFEEKYPNVYIKPDVANNYKIKNHNKADFVYFDMYVECNGVCKLYANNFYKLTPDV